MLAAPGIYTGQLLKGALTTSSKGTPCMEVHFKVDVGGAPISRTVYIYLTDACMGTKASPGASHAKLTALGFNWDFKNPAFTATDVELICNHEEYDGKMRDKWEIANWGTGIEGKPAGADVVRSLQARWGGKTTTAKKSVAAPAAPSAPKANGGMTKDQAWATFLQYNGEDPDVAKWNQYLSRVGPDETKFTAADWAQVAEHCEPPF